MAEILRDARPKSPEPARVTDHGNLYAVTHLPGARFVPVESGINRMVAVGTPDGSRAPANLIASSPHKVWRTETPWQQVFDVDNGHIRCYGDNKTRAAIPPARSNKALLEAFAAHGDSAVEVRRRAIPLNLLQTRVVRRSPEGVRKIRGFGLITRAERVAQRGDSGESFANYAFDFLVLDLSAAHEMLPWDRTNARRDPTLDDARGRTRLLADLGVGRSSGAQRVRRRTARRLIEPGKEQMPEAGSREETILSAIHQAFEGRRLEFDGLAAWVTERVLQRSDASARSGSRADPRTEATTSWVGWTSARPSAGPRSWSWGRRNTRPCARRRTDWTSRTVARLRRGQIGVYVTTSYFSRRTLQEVIDDRHPILLIYGWRLAEEVRSTTVERGEDKVDRLSDEIV